jgi:hypothetical protein
MAGACRFEGAIMQLQLQPNCSSGRLKRGYRRSTSFALIIKVNSLSEDPSNYAHVADQKAISTRQSGRIACSNYLMTGVGSSSPIHTSDLDTLVYGNVTEPHGRAPGSAKR